ncbi:MAG: DUF86 domain-containing protein [Caldilineaceae bacterium]|nr:DUF86 domain-containing protein [Caldilineaceae bacterium]
MPKDERVYLRHMLDAARKIEMFTAGRQRANLENDEMLSLAVVRLLEILGEASRNISSDLRQRNPQIPWAAIAGTRNRLIHGYFDVDLDIVWAIVVQDIPNLIPQIEKLLEE